MSFTPGPWKSGRREDETRWLSIGDPTSRPHFQGDIVCSDSDADLICVAPQLYEACKSVYEWLMEGGEPTEGVSHSAFCKAYKSVTEALSKAEGKL